MLMNSSPTVFSIFLYEQATQDRDENGESRAIKLHARADAEDDLQDRCVLLV